MDAEKRGIRCNVIGCHLSYEEHEQVLLVKCKSEDKKKLQAYLLRIKDLATKEGFVGFAFVKGF